MNYRYLDMDTYKRKSHFTYFRSLAYPYVGVTVNVDITDALVRMKRERLPFFLTVCYCVAQAANSIPEFRQRIKEEGIVEFDWCKTSHTVALEDGTYCYCALDGNMPLKEFLPYAEREQEAARQRHSIEEEEDVLGEFFISTLPWLSYTSLIQPVPVPADSNPRITWGKYFSSEGRTLLPVTVLCHHALVDGIHLAAFYEKLQEQLGAVAAGITV
ncbi:CatA-like O-acetyltransferase [Marvinbryantia formatexigens]|nr:CatA-like O-acetyltransferase [Marvinbryantia formatexigens]UWO24872.1 CatA-like O-acetyltransferase [Marvinbryantia formatexigens DSM 14469]SDG78022.1 chloramphenicol O-acetyltransferase type A [Marvinbryantia formatexigens]